MCNIYTYYIAIFPFPSCLKNTIRILIPLVMRIIVLLCYCVVLLCYCLTLSSPSLTQTKIYL